MNLWIDIAIATFLSAMREISNGDKAKKKVMKKATLKVFNTIKTVYADDEDFNPQGSD